MFVKCVKCWVLSFKCLVLSVEFWVSSVECWVLSFECWVLRVKCRVCSVVGGIWQYMGPHTGVCRPAGILDFIVDSRSIGCWNRFKYYMFYYWHTGYLIQPIILFCLKTIKHFFTQRILDTQSVWLCYFCYYGPCI